MKHPRHSQIKAFRVMDWIMWPFHSIYTNTEMDNYSINNFYFLLGFSLAGKISLSSVIRQKGKHSYLEWLLSRKPKDRSVFCVFYWHLAFSKQHALRKAEIISHVERKITRVLCLNQLYFLGLLTLLIPSSICLLTRVSHTVVCCRSNTEINNHWVLYALIYQVKNL